MFSLVKFVSINLHYILNWWYLLGMRTIVITLYAIYKKMLFSILHILFLMRNIFSEYTDSLLKVYKLCDKLLDKISSKTELSVFNPSRKINLLQYPFYLFKITLLLILFYLLFLISLYLSHIPQGLKSLQ